jgi:hypothetical protein
MGWSSRYFFVYTFLLNYLFSLAYSEIDLALSSQNIDSQDVARKIFQNKDFAERVNDEGQTAWGCQSPCMQSPAWASITIVTITRGKSWHPGAGNLL